MKNSTRTAELLSNPSENYSDLYFLQDLQKKSKHSDRWITCSDCGKTITKQSLSKHQISCHGYEKVGGFK